MYISSYHNASGKCFFPFSDGVNDSEKKAVERDSDGRSFSRLLLKRGRLNVSKNRNFWLLKEYSILHAYSRMNKNDDIGR